MPCLPDRNNRHRHPPPPRALYVITSTTSLHLSLVLQHYLFSLVPATFDQGFSLLSPTPIPLACFLDFPLISPSYENNVYFPVCQCTHLRTKTTLSRSTYLSFGLGVSLSRNNNKNLHNFIVALDLPTTYAATAASSA